MSETFYFPCRQCGEPRFLSRGRCAECDPDRHAWLTETIAAFSLAAELYKADTDLEPLDDYDAFEAWISQRTTKTREGAA
jgi:hypothetical protein